MNKQQFLTWLETWPSSCDLPLIMGILNITPDSFSDAGAYFSLDKALTHARLLIEQGADILDIGGASTRPGAARVSLTEELDRVIPVLEKLKSETDICLSIDTTKADVMVEAAKLGVGLINDISALSGPGSLATAANLQLPVCLMHMQGSPQTMQINPSYSRGVIEELNEFFTEKIKVCLDAGLLKQHLILDPGFCFGKTVAHNLTIVRELERFEPHGLPLLLGVSRKSTLGIILNQPVDKRVIGGVALNIIAALKGVAMIRTHDVKENKEAFTMLKAVLHANQEG